MKSGLSKSQEERIPRFLTAPLRSFPPDHVLRCVAGTVLALPAIHIIWRVIVIIGNRL